MISVPEAWQLPSTPSMPPVSIRARSNSAGKDCSGERKYPHSNSTGTPAISQWPEIVSLPVERSRAQAQRACVGIWSSHPGSALPLASAAA